MSSAFDPYYKWLAIPPAEQPPNHYRLLALNLFESDADVISTAADQRMAHVRSFQSGQYVDASQRLLNELASARICLLKPDKKSAYDAALRAKIAEQIARAAPPPPPPMIAAPMAATPLTAAPMSQSPTPTFPSRQEAAIPVQLVEVERPIPAAANPAHANPAQMNPVQPAAAAPAADWHDELDLLGLSTGGNHSAKRPTVARARKPTLPKIFFLGPLIGVAAVIAAVTYNNIRDAMDQPGNDSPNGRTGKSIKRPIETSLHTGGPGGKYGVGSANSRPGSNSTPQFSPGDDSASTAPDGSQPPPSNPTPTSDSSSTHPDVKSPAAAARVPVPDAEEQRKTLVEIKKVFKDEFAKATTIEGRKALAKKLGEEAAKTKDDPTTRYVLATQSLENAIKLCDAKLASELVHGLSLYYDIDAWELKAKTLSQLAAVAKTAEARQLIASGAYDLVDKALAEERYDAAVQLANCAFDLAATSLRDTTFREKAREARARAHRMQQEAAEVQTAQERLAVQSDDAAAHLLIGRFFCMERDDWDSGLPHLVRGSDPELAALARQELAGAAKTADQVALADAWWDLADHRREGPDLPLVKGMRNRAVYWYRRAMSQLSGFAQAKAQKRIAEATAVAKP